MNPPRPKIVKQVCSLCGRDWKDHGKAPIYALTVESKT